MEKIARCCAAVTPPVNPQPTPARPRANYTDAIRRKLIREIGTPIHAALEPGAVP